MGDDGDHRVFYTPDERIMVLLEEAFLKVWRAFEESTPSAKSKRHSERWALFSPECTPCHAPSHSHTFR